MNPCWGRSRLILFFLLSLDSVPLHAEQAGCSLRKDFNVDCEEDAICMLQTRTTIEQSRSKVQQRASDAGRLESRAQFRSVTLPFKMLTVNRSQVSAVPVNYSVGNLIAYQPSHPVNRELFVFLPGTNNACEKHTHLLESVAPSMMTLCLPYDNLQLLGDVCKDDGACWIKHRLAAYNGSYDGVSGNNFITRLKSALEYLGRKHSLAWSRYLGSAGPKFESMRLAGHSQGAGEVAMVAYQNVVSRVVQISGPCDTSDWYKTLKPSTPASRFFGFASVYDRFCDWESRQMPAWFSEGIISEKLPVTLVSFSNMSSFDPKVSQTVLSSVPAPSCKSDLCLKDNHDALALDQWDSVDYEPYAQGLWQRLMGL